MKPTDSDDQDKQSEREWPTGLGLKLLLIGLFVAIFLVLRACGVIDELPLKMGVLEFLFK